MLKSPYRKRKESKKSLSENNDDLEEYESNIFNNIENQNIELSINDYVYKLRKILIEKTHQNKISEEQKNDNANNFQIHHGEKKNLAFNLSLIPFLKFIINPVETMDEINYIFSKKTRTLNEVIYLQHLLNLYDQKYFSNLKNDTSDINEVMFNMSICLNMHKYQQNEILFKYGDINDKLFFLLSGRVTLLEIVENKCYMSIEQYVEYLSQLVNIGEYELIRKTIDRNKVYKNNNAVIKIKNNDEKEIKKIMNENLKINKVINKLHHIANIEFNLNIESKVKFEFPRDIISQKEIISVEDYIKRVLPPFIKERANNKKKKVLFSDIKEKVISNSYNRNKGRNKHVVVYYSYSLKNKLSPFNIIGELSQDNEIMDKTGLTNQNKKKSEYSFTAICTEPSILLHLNLNTYEKFVKQRQESITTKNANSILEIPFFKGLNANIFKEKYYNLFTLYNFKNGETIFKQGEKMNNIYFIKSGEIELTMEASMYDINNIIELIKKKNMKEMEQNNLINKNKKKKKIILNSEDEDNLEILKKIKSDKNVKKWRIMRINYKDIIGLNEILDSKNKYYMSAKCMSYIGEIFVIDSNKFYEMLNDDKGVKNLFLEYCIKKEKLIYERLNSIKNIFINDKFKVQKKKLLKTLSWQETKTINFNNLTKKRNDINLDLINSALENSHSGNIHLNSDNIKVLKNNEEKPIENQILYLSSEENKNRMKSARYSYKTKISSTGRNSKAFEETKTSRKSKKTKIKKALSFFNDNDDQELLMNQRYNSDNVVKVHKFKKSKSYFGLVKFKDFNNLIKASKNSYKKPINFNSEINPNFKKYLKDVRKYRLDSAKSPKINPFSRVFFPFQKDNINIKSHFLNFNGFSNKFENCNFNKIECLVLDKFIDAEEYKKNKEKNDRFINNKRQLSVKELKKSIKSMYKKNKFPQHLIKRLEGERKINYFPEKLLHFQNKKGIFILG